jgi:uncharacterized protein YjbJ (UPF0337 family)
MELNKKSLCFAHIGSSYVLFKQTTNDNEEATMNWDIIKGDWKQFKGKAQIQWGKLTDSDLEMIEGKREELAGRIQKAYGVTKDEAEKQINAFEAKMK